MPGITRIIIIQVVSVMDIRTYKRPSLTSSTVNRDSGGYIFNGSDRFQIELDCLLQS